MPGGEDDPSGRLPGPHSSVNNRYQRWNDVDTTGRKIVFMAWGEKYIEEVFNCITKSALPDYPKILITDGQTVVDLDIPDLTVIRVEFELDGRARKAGLIDLLPHDCSSYLFD